MSMPLPCVAAVELLLRWSVGVLTSEVRLIVNGSTNPERAHQQQFSLKNGSGCFIERPRHLDRYHSNINSGVCVDSPVIGRFHVKGTQS